jgi:hypothetical protein
MFPSSYEDDITTLLEGNALSIPVHRGNFVPSADQARSTHRQGYVVWDEDSMQPHVCSEGYGDSSGKQVIDFYLDIIVYANTAAKRRTALDAVLDIVQPVVSGRRTILTAHTVGTTFFNYLRVLAYEDVFNVKTAASMAEVVGRQITLACKITV